jgi:hypothetical protein
MPPLSRHWWMSTHSDSPCGLPLSLPLSTGNKGTSCALDQHADVGHFLDISTVCG